MHRKTDSEIEQAVLKELQLQELSLSEKTCSREVCVFARDGVVTVKGSALSYADKERLRNRFVTPMVWWAW